MPAPACFACLSGKYTALDIPLAVMVIDEGAWDLLGDEGWGGCANGSVTAAGAACPCFAPAESKSMVQTLANLGVEVMLSPYLQFAVPWAERYAAGAAKKAFVSCAPALPPRRAWQSEAGKHHAVQ